MRNSCDACAIKVMLKKYGFGEEYNAVEEGGLVRRCGAQSKDEEMEVWW